MIKKIFNHVMFILLSFTAPYFVFAMESSDESTGSRYFNRKATIADICTICYGENEDKGPLMLLLLDKNGSPTKVHAPCAYNKYIKHKRLQKKIKNLEAFQEERIETYNKANDYKKTPPTEKEIRDLWDKWVENRDDLSKEETCYLARYLKPDYFTFSKDIDEDCAAYTWIFRKSSYKDEEGKFYSTISLLKENHIENCRIAYIPGYGCSIYPQAETRPSATLLDLFSQIQRLLPDFDLKNFSISKVPEETPGQ